jgi:hypothetical protein
MTLLNGVTLLLNSDNGYDNTKCAARCAQDTQCTAGVSCDQMITEYKHEEYCDMLLTSDNSKQLSSDCGTGISVMLPQSTSPTR